MSATVCIYKGRASSAIACVVALSFYLAMTMTAALAASATDIPANDPRTIAREHIETELAHVGTSVSATLLPSRHDLSDCANPVAFLQSKKFNANGRLFVGLQCQGALERTVFLPAQINVQGAYLVATTSIKQGTLVTPAMLEVRKGELTSMIESTFSEPSDAIGKMAARNIERGGIIKRAYLQQALLVRRGQPVFYEIIGSGFRISGRGEALQEGHAGDLVNVRTEGSKLLAGRLSPEGVVKVSF
ncbi:hypothetical protein GCM10007052_18590 [Halioglobus japonicus]|uniref:Flagella basal body P-ring formation protein FlgA n=1 Tax=Halioglobus japonicus TaxID=930805 RepID=A0AAP8SMY3_9GAMM|nr:flagellar basal body P-ring formation chaperone FlgA [Halioglobus japonicus]PLW86070.1 flagella basal body P-ring formation protein FlgA [Halioglobus japonicus]GHD14640.1 hypothetical protein GCM10007052_18590 [Halioglobus japonicus]